MNNQIIRTVKELFNKNINNSSELSLLIDKYLIPQELEKKTNAEVSTPHCLRKDMLDKIPQKFWRKPRKVFEPCCGKGGFLIDILGRFMDGLKDKIPNEQERYKKIVEECLYWSDINPTNIYICKLLLDPYGQYELNYNEGNTLELDIKDKWNLDGFNAVIGNPPYNSSGNTGTGNTIWQLFTKKALDEWLLRKGYLVFVHPSGWRKPCYQKSQLKGLFNLMTTDNYMMCLSIHGIKDGQRIFKCGTRYDFYVIQRTDKINKTIITDEVNNTCEILLSDYEWLPNRNIEKVLNLISNNKENNLRAFMDSSYHAIRDYVSDTQDDTFKYPLVHSTPKSGIRYKYSSRNDKGHFGIPKIIFGEAGINHVVLDIDGQYGMTQGAIGIVIDTKEEGEIISKALMTDEFKDILNSCSWGNFRIDWQLITFIRKDFWREIF